jgi:cation transporter-like permease
MKKTLIALLTICTVLAADSASAQNIRQHSGAIPNQYIVVLASADDAEAVGLETQRLYGGRLGHVYRKALNGFAIRLTPAAAAALARDPRVRYVEEDGVIGATGLQSNPPSWGLDRIDQRNLPLDGVYAYPTFNNQVFVHVIDTGVRISHVDFGGRAFNAGDSVDDDNNPSTPPSNDDGDPSTADGLDCNGHGTHVAGTIAGATYGVAKNAIILSHRALNCAGQGTTSSVIGAIDAVAADLRRPAVANMSLGGSPSSALDDAVRSGITAGVTFVLSAGNSGADASTSSPARVAEAITVGATTPDDVRAGFSNFGPLVDVFAPGTGIISAGISSDTASASLSGTSMAAPHVAGVAALYLEQVGTKSPSQVQAAIVAAATLGVVGSPGTGSPNRLLYSGFTIQPGTSPDGTMVPTATQIVDTVGAVWTIGANGAILRNGVQAGGGWGSKILWKSSTIYVLGNDTNWWQWTGSGWINLGTTVPGGGGSSASPDGTTIPNATQIVDTVGAVWTLGANGAILRNGVQAAGGWGSKILWTSNTIYVLGSDTNWWQWTGSGWINVGTTVPGGSSASPDGTTVPTATQIVDTVGAVWTLGANGAILRNGVQAGGGWGSKILWKSATIYVFGTDGNWWRWTGSGWINVGTTTP